jgi:hypothetical protein
MVDEQTKQTTPTSETPISIIERAEAANKALEDNIKRQEELLRRQEEIAAKQLLAGRSTAGQTAPVVNKDEAAKERINNLLKGTGLKI